MFINNITRLFGRLLIPSRTYGSKYRCTYRRVRSRLRAKLSLISPIEKVRLDAERLARHNAYSTAWYWANADRRRSYLKIKMREYRRRKALISVKVAPAPAPFVGRREQKRLAALKR